MGSSVVVLKYSAIQRLVPELYAKKYAFLFSNCIYLHVVVYVFRLTSVFPSGAIEQGRRIVGELVIGLLGH